ncbi:exodeoxyribonuclease I [Gallibacterium anatis]|uniref:exodeoxyribonuclease I n=1 Tax=Gallibacterium anatis TaxID=750 RepID=UPI000BA038F0|nr:exodeoxyribonuclease I [Gallibacterium anatis]OZN48690.1 exodeoxyribonuclease I [Gallibacterium anatis]
MSNFSFFIYDYESFGVDPARDRPAQFAGIRTDKDFNIIGEPLVLYCKQTNDYLPHPAAVTLTGITPQLCNQQGISEPEFAAKILEEFSQPNTCIMGYNNIRFDDEMTRYTFYRNFIDPYAYSYSQGNSRWDLLDVIRATYALRPEGINWIYDDEGMPSFRLELLTKANNIEHSHAHDAMSDVYATIEMAKLIKQQQPKLFDYFFTHRSKKEIEELIDYVNMTPLVHVSGMLGNYRSNISWMVPLALHPTNKNAVIFCDLAADIDDLLTLSVEELKQNLYTKKAELELQGKKSVPLKLVHCNKCPILAPAKTLRPQDAERVGIDRQQCLTNLAKLQAMPEIREKVHQIFLEEYDNDYDDVETALYKGFFSYSDKNNLAILRTLSPEQLANHGLTFQDKRIPELLFRYRARHFYKTLSRAEQIKWQKYCHAKLDASSAEFIAEFEMLSAQYANDESKLLLLQNLYEYSLKLSD